MFFLIREAFSYENMLVRTKYRSKYHQISKSTTLCEGFIAPSRAQVELLLDSTVEVPLITRVKRLASQDAGRDSAEQFGTY